MKYIEYLNSVIKKEVAKPENAVLFGQNINAGSSLAGLTRGMQVNSGGKIINSTNSENSLVGFGFGLMLGGASGVFFMKQMDFLLLGIDHLVNTYNVIRGIKKQPKEGSFSIMAVVVDSGYEGPQSSLNNFADFCSIANVPGFTITNKEDADYILGKHLVQSGFRILGVSQRLFKTEILEPEKPLQIYGSGEIFKYSEGNDLTLVSFNFSFPQVYELRKNLKEKGLSSEHFNVNSALAADWSPIKESLKKTGKLVVVDDSKSRHIPAESLLADLRDMNLKKTIFLRREMKENWTYPISDVFEIDAEQIAKELK